MKMFTPQGTVAEVAPNQVQILLKAGWTREKKMSSPVQPTQPAQPTEPVEKQEESTEEKKIRKILRPKE